MWDRYVTGGCRSNGSNFSCKIDRTKLMLLRENILKFIQKLCSLCECPKTKAIMTRFSISRKFLHSKKILIAKATSHGKKFDINKII